MDNGRTARWVKTRSIADDELIAALRAPRTLRTGAGVLAHEASIAGSPLDELAAQRIEELLRERHDRAGDLEFGIPCFQTDEEALRQHEETWKADAKWRAGFISGFHRARWRKTPGGRPIIPERDYINGLLLRTAAIQQSSPDASLLEEFVAQVKSDHAAIDALTSLNTQQAGTIADLTTQRTALRKALEPFAVVGRWLGRQGLRWPPEPSRSVIVRLLYHLGDGPSPKGPTAVEFVAAADAMGDHP